MSQDEIEAHEAAMQRVVEDETLEQEAINDKKKRDIGAAPKAFNEAMKAAEKRNWQPCRGTASISPSSVKSTTRLQMMCLS